MIELHNIVCEDISDKFYYNKRLSWNSYKNVYIPSDKIVKLSLINMKAKSFPLTRTAIEVSNSASSPSSPFVVIFYQTSAIPKKDEVSCHRNATQIPNHIFGHQKMFCMKPEKNV